MCDGLGSTGLFSSSSLFADIRKHEHFQDIWDILFFIETSWMSSADGWNGLEKHFLFSSHLSQRCKKTEAKHQRRGACSPCGNFKQFMKSDIQNCTSCTRNVWSRAFLYVKFRQVQKKKGGNKKKCLYFAGGICAPQSESGAWVVKVAS